MSSWFSWLRNNPSKTKIEIPIIEVKKEIIKKPIIEVEEEIINILKSIKEDFKKSYSIYNDFYNRITGGIYKENMHTFCTEDVPAIQVEMNIKKNDIIDSIQKIKNNHKEFGEIIINLLKENDKDLVFSLINYKANVFANLKYIIEYYFYKINLGIEKSYPKLLKIKHQLYRDWAEPITYPISKNCFRDPKNTPIPPSPPSEDSTSPTPPTPPPRNPNYTHSEVPRPQIPPIPPPRISKQ